MKLLHLPVIVVTLCTLAGTLSAQLAAATAFVPHAVIEEAQTDKGAAGIVCLFHGTDPDVARHLLGQNFSAFRDPAVNTSPVGKVRLTEMIGAHHLEAITIEGELKAGDVVRLGDIYTLVVLINGRCEALPKTDQEAGK